jgi:uncharacterized membrane protein YkoI
VTDDDVQTLAKEDEAMGTHKTSMVVAVITGMGAIGWPTTALADDCREIRALAKTQISLMEAISAAEMHQGGRAYDASLDDDRFGPEYEVDVIADGRSYEVRVDGISGEIIGARKDRRSSRKRCAERD